MPRNRQKRAVEYRDTFEFRLFPDYTYTNAQKRRFYLFQGRIEHWRKAVNYADAFAEPNRISLLYLIGYPKGIQKYIEKTKGNLVILCADAPPDFLTAYDEYWNLVELYHNIGYASKDGVFSEKYFSQIEKENAHRGDGLLPEEVYEKNDKEAAIIAAYEKAKLDAKEIFSRYRLICKTIPEKWITQDKLDWIIKKFFPYGREQTGMENYKRLKDIEKALHAGLFREDISRILKLPKGTDCYKACQKNIRRCEMDLNVSLRETGQADLVQIMERMKNPPYGWSSDIHAAYCYGYAVSGHIEGTWVWDENVCFKTAEAIETALLTVLMDRMKVVRRERFILLEETGSSLSERFSYVFGIKGQEYTPRDETDAKILELHKEGKSIRRIAEELGTMSNVSVHKRLEKMRKVGGGAIPFCNLAHLICKKLEDTNFRWPVSLLDDNLRAALCGTYDEDGYYTPIFGTEKVRKFITYFTHDRCRESKKKLDNMDKIISSLIQEKYGHNVDVAEIKRNCTTESSSWLWETEVFWKCVNHYIRKD